MSNSLTLSTNFNSKDKIDIKITGKNKLENSSNLLEFKEIYPDSIEEIKIIEKQQIEKQNFLIKLIKDAENKTKEEQKRGKEINVQKELEVNKRKIELKKLKENNNRFKFNLNKLQVETNKKLDKIEMKEKNEVYEKEKEKRQSSLDILLKVKEKEIVNSLHIIEEKKKKKNDLEKMLEKNVDINQINIIYDKIKNTQKELDELEKEKEKLKKIQEEHNNCTKNQENIIREIENIKREIKVIQIKNRNKMDEDRKIIYSYENKNEEHISRPKSKKNI